LPENRLGGANVDGRNPANSPVEGLVVYPNIFLGFIHPKAVSQISEPSTVTTSPLGVFDIFRFWDPNLNLHYLLFPGNGDNPSQNCYWWWFHNQKLIQV